MKNKLQILPIISFAILLSSCSQYYTQLGNSQYNAFGYKKASGYFEKAVLKKKKITTLEKLADCFYKINDYKNAEKYFKESVADAKCTPTTKLHYAQTLMSLGKYDEAKSQLNSVLAEQADNAIAKSLLSSCNAIPAFVKDSNRYTVNKLDISGFESSFSPVVYKEGLVYAAEKKEVRRKEVYRGTMMGYAHLYYAKKDAQGKLGEPIELNGNVNKKFHNSTAAFANGGSEIYYSSVNSDKIKLSEKYSKVYNMSINHDSIVDNEWKKAKTFPYNSPDYSNSHPTLTADGKTMYFASDMPGGFGGSDIYVTRLANGEWSKPTNLGTGINTGGNENFPVVGIDNKLYFSSNGLKGLGGLDIFVSEITGNSYGTPKNLNYPINSKSDDFGLLWNADKKSGYLSSNRNNSDRIFTFVVNPYKVVADGKVTNKENSAAIAGATIILKNVTTAAVDSVFTDSDGNYSFELLNDCDYTYEVRKNGYFSVTKDGIDTKNLTENKTITNNFVLQELVVDKPVVLENPDMIFYDLDKSDIRPDAIAELDKLLKLLNDNPKVKIELSSHTDSRADDKYNQNLSNRRAKAAAEYLHKKGISRKRISSKGYGETKLVNKCSNDVVCTEQEHQQNRRTEFKVIKEVPEEIAPVDKKTKKKKK